jgi:hypothetical protein
MMDRATKLLGTFDDHADALTDFEIELMVIDFEHQFPHLDIR